MQQEITLYIINKGFYIYYISLTYKVRNIDYAIKSCVYLGRLLAGACNEYIQVFTTSGMI